jgi:hypothetical protein
VPPGHHRDAPGIDEVEHRLRAHAHDLAHQPEVDLLAVDRNRRTLRREQAGVLTGQPDGQGAVLVEQSHELAAHLPHQDHPDHLERLGGRHP